MEVSGLLKVRVRRGINLAVRDDVSRTSDPYVVLRSGLQKVRTTIVKDSVNPVWEEDLTTYVKDLNNSITLLVLDKDTFTDDDDMGNAEIDIKPLVDCMTMRLEDLPHGTTVERIRPTTENCLAKESRIVWSDGRVTQDMTLKLRNVETGEIEITIEWFDLPNDTGIHI